MNRTPGCAENNAVTAILLSLLILTLTFGASGQVWAQTSPQEAAKFVEELGNEAGTLLAAVKTQAP